MIESINFSFLNIEWSIFILTKCNYFNFRRVSQYDTGFELPEDCKNMSFSELFDQELFSTQGKNVDLVLYKIKIIITKYSILHYTQIYHLSNYILL